MKKIKGLLTIILAMMVAAGSLSACGTADPTNGTSSESISVVSSVTDETEALRTEILSDVAIAQRSEPKDSYDFGGKTVIFASPWVHDLILEPGTTEAGDKFLERIREVEENFNVKIETATSEYGYFCDKIFTAAAAGTKFADIIELDSRWLSILAYPGYIKPLNQLTTGVDIKDPKWHPTQLSASKLSKNIYGVKSVPVEMQNVIFWNKTLFEEQNLPNLYELYENKTWTWDKMKEIAALGTKIGADGTVEQWGLGGAEIERDLILSNDGSIMSEDSEGKLRFT
ncbi:MAG: extracellular solute-binding protein, partial [Saccharofermentanales bacterium]